LVISSTGAPTGSSALSVLDSTVMPSVPSRSVVTAALLLTALSGALMKVSPKNQ
jgi:hypothetical protein